MNGVEVHPPMYEKKVGRPKKIRKKEPVELEGGSKISKYGVTMHCSVCNGVDHNNKGHYKPALQNQGAIVEEDDPTVLQV